MEDAYPMHVEFHGSKDSDTVRVTWKCHTLDAAMLLIRNAAAMYTSVEATYQRETGELVLVLQ